MSIHVEHPSRGMAIITLGAAGRRLTYRCDPATHRVLVSDEFGRAVIGFGGPGSGPARFNTPLDIAFVRPEFVGEVLPATGPDAAWLAVADYGNRRVQILELDGAYVGAIDFDRTIDRPCAIDWRPPVLEVEGVECRRTRLHLSASILSGYRGYVPQPREWRFPQMRVN